MSQNCCDYGCTGKGINCPARPDQNRPSQAQGRVMEAEPWAFPDESPHAEVLHDIWDVIIIALVVVVALAVVVAAIFI